MSSSTCGRILRQPRIYSPFVRFCPTELNYTTTARTSASQPVFERKIISTTVKTEGGPEHGSEAAQMQSRHTREQNFEKTAPEIGGKMQATPEGVTSEDAVHLKSREARATGQAQPPKDSISAETERLAAVNGGATKGPSQAGTDPATQSAVDRKENFERAAAGVAPKIETNPEKVTQEDVSLLQSREHRAFGETTKGGIASLAHSLASENEKKGAI